ncbi:hypothetical protein KFE98_13530 [bacterium SCSIO 12741]|nr:hypothetical protein KFE98_13530 [bacterium SCSIO 12741]
MKTILTLLLSLTILGSQAQDVEVLSGSIEDMMSIKFWELNVDYADLQITERKVSLGSESDYKYKIEEEIAKESEQKAESWEKQYEAKKAKTYPTKFSVSFNKILLGSRQIMIATESYMDQVEGEVRVIPEKLELGWKKGRRMGEALLTARVEFYNEAGDLLFSMRLTNCPGVPSGSGWIDASDWYATYQRVNESFAKCGKEAAIYIDDNFPKKKKK